MKEGTKFGLKILGWMFSSIMWLCTSLYILTNLINEESKLFMCLLLWMIISGVGLLYSIWIIGSDAEVLLDETEDKA